MTEILAQIIAPKFVAAIVLRDDIVVEAAPIVGYMKREKWSRDRVRSQCKAWGWKVSIVKRLVGLAQR
jgi:hypothetical protein